LYFVCYFKIFFKSAFHNTVVECDGICLTMFLCRSVWGRHWSWHHNSRPSCGISEQVNSV